MKKIFIYLKKCINIFIIFELILILSILITMYSLLNITRKNITKEKVNNYIENVDFITLIKNQYSKELEEYINIQSEFIDAGISKISFDKFMNSNELKEYTNNIFIAAAEKFIYSDNVNIEINVEEINSLIENNLSELQESNKELLDSEKEILKNKIKQKMPDIIDNINKLFDKIVDKFLNLDKFIRVKNIINILLDIFNIINSKIIDVVMLTLILSFIIIIFKLNNNSYKSLIYIVCAFCLSELSLIIIKYLINKISFLKSLIINLLDDLNFHILIIFIISLIFIIINLVIYLKNKKR